MCTVCILLDKDKITKREAMRAFWEQVMFADSQEEVEHIQSAYGKLHEELKQDTQETT